MTLLDEYWRKVAAEYTAADATLIPEVRNSRLANAARWARTAARLEGIVQARERTS